MGPGPPTGDLYCNIFDENMTTDSLSESIIIICISYSHITDFCSVGYITTNDYYFWSKRNNTT